MPKRREIDKQQAAALGHYNLSADGSVKPIHDDGMSMSMKLYLIPNGRD